MEDKLNSIGMKRIFHKPITKVVGAILVFLLVFMILLPGLKKGVGFGKEAAAQSSEPDTSLVKD